MVLPGPNNRAYSDGDTLGCAVIGNQRVRARHVPGVSNVQNGPVVSLRTFWVWTSRMVRRRYGPTMLDSKKVLSV